MRTLVCFGDSNTWGYDPASHGAPFPSRHPLEIRWTGVLAHALGDGYRVIEEGQNGRMTVHQDPFNPARRGLDYLPACLESHKPIDLVIMMLGSNDLKTFLNLPPIEVANGAGVLARLILTSTAGPHNHPPKLLLICPPAIGGGAHLPDLATRVFDGPARSRELPRHFEALAASLGCAYLNSQDHSEPSPIDGVHLEAPAHAKLGQAVAVSVRRLLE